MSKYRGNGGEKRTQEKRKKEKVEETHSAALLNNSQTISLPGSFVGAAVTGRVGVLDAEAAALAPRQPPLPLFQRHVVVPVPITPILIVVIIVLIAAIRPCTACLPAMRIRRRRNITQRPNAHAAHPTACPAAYPCTVAI
jgi:hypothetical protein